MNIFFKSQREELLADENIQLLEKGKQMTDLVLAFSVLVLWHSRDLTRRNKSTPGSRKVSEVRTAHFKDGGKE